ncbi:hypothetical protein LTR85_009086 [Meristemomyces frigidus]|nr:hypothetical protein LTR85_009086 [Meristemomyces frigidus]
MDFADASVEYGTPFWDFHRADLQMCLLRRAEELGATFQINARVVDIEFPAQDDRSPTVVLYSGDRFPPTPTGDLAYRLLLQSKDVAKDPDLAPFLDGHTVRYWMGPQAHVVMYVLRNGELFNMVFLVPDDMPAGATTLEGNVLEMRAFFRDWDPRITKLLNLCQSVQKWKLCYRPGLETPWSHQSDTFTLLGDAVHATLPYLASGAGMSLEDGATLGLCFARLKGRSASEKKLALRVYEACRRERTESIVERRNVQQVLYHLDDGEEQKARDARFRAFGQMEAAIKESRGRAEGLLLPERLVESSDPLVWRRHGVGKWLLNFDCQADVNAHWATEEEYRSEPPKLHL